MAAGRVWCLGRTRLRVRKDQGQLGSQAPVTPQDHHSLLPVYIVRVQVPWRGMARRVQTETCLAAQSSDKPTAPPEIVGYRS